MATQLARMFPPGDGKHTTTSANGRPYTCNPGGYLDVVDHDAQVLSANGWTRFGGGTCFVGPTTARPTNAPGGQPIVPGQCFYDTTLSALLTFDRLAVVWRGPTGAAM